MRPRGQTLQTKSGGSLERLMRSRVQEIPEHQVKRSARSQMSARGAQPAMDTVRSTSERVTGRGLPASQSFASVETELLGSGGRDLPADGFATPGTRPSRPRSRVLGAVWVALYWGRFVFPGATGTPFGEAGGGEGVTLGPFRGVVVTFGYLGPAVELGVAV